MCSYDAAKGCRKVRKSRRLAGLGGWHCLWWWPLSLKPWAHELALGRSFISCQDLETLGSVKTVIHSYRVHQRPGANGGISPPLPTINVPEILGGGMRDLSLPPGTKQEVLLCWGLGVSTILCWVAGDKQLPGRDLWSLLTTWQPQLWSPDEGSLSLSLSLSLFYMVYVSVFMRCG